MRVRAFAARIAGRYRRGAIRRGISLPLAAASRSMDAHAVHRHVRFGDVLQARLQMNVHLHRTLITAATPASREPLARPSAPPRGARAAAAEAVAPRRRVSIAERLPLRARRLEAALPSHSLMAAARSVRADAAAAPPVPRTVPPLTLVRRNEPAARSSESAAAAAHVDRGAADADRRNAQTTRASQSRHAETAIVADGEIERLAERVIGSIDRRIAAQRERLGRF